MDKFHFGHNYSRPAPLPTNECSHGIENSILTKHGVLFKHSIKCALECDTEDDTEIKRWVTGDPCQLCGIIYAFWRHYASHSNLHSLEVYTDSQAYCDKQKLPRTFAAPAHVDSEIRVQLEPKQLGEAYHVLVCCALLPLFKNRDIRIRYGKPKDADEIKSLEGINDLFKWYRTQKERFDGPSETKGAATRVIADAFRACNKAAKGNTERRQSDLFVEVRRILNPDFKRVVTYREGIGHLAQRYFTPAYAAKFWLNRYLSLTSRFEDTDASVLDDALFGPLEALQRRSKKNTGEGPIYNKLFIPKTSKPNPDIAPPDPPCNPRKLPKKAEVQRLAVIHVRGDGVQTKAGRAMDEQNLTEVASALANANIIADVAGTPRFSHVMLYGDFDYAQVPDFVGLVRKAVDPSVQVLFISSPWAAAATDVAPVWPNEFSENAKRQLNQKRAEVDVFWAQFRAFDSDFLPVQVKTLAIWTALCERYHPKICVVGHRSGFVEGAGFLGLPIFYLNNERGDIDKEREVPSLPGELLWEPPANPSGDRLRELSDVMDTFIPIEMLGKDMDANEVLRVDPRFREELAAALFMYMCSERPVRVRKGTKRGDELEFRIVPAWMARVDMMHDTYGDVQPEDSAPYHDYMHPTPLPASQIGQQWLQDTYNISGYILRSWEHYIQQNKWDHRFDTFEDREHGKAVVRRHISRVMAGLVSEDMAGGEA
ncbi:hypothetical protein IQ07DRAFT_382434 [Pyrenochaeta sp. DS3sAY3a]|nr:hypothetical protein IQ07DRAFT_382434 [Pyrenochaeta sp. DS3sAY3a]